MNTEGTAILKEIDAKIALSDFCCNETVTACA